MNKTFRAFLKALSSVAANTSAAWFGLAFVTPSFPNLTTTEIILVLTKDVLFGIVFLLASALIEKHL